MTSLSKKNIALNGVLLMLLFSAVTFAQNDKFRFSGINNYDAVKIAGMETPVKPIINIDEAPKKKSVLLAGVFSAILPGAGEFYSESYLKSAIFLGVEVASIIVGEIYNKKGDNQTAFFQNFANKNWSVVRYANWTIANAKKINPDVDASLFNVFDSNGDVIWRKLNDLENAIGQGTNYYSHRLAFYGEQQYYEMIGKYPQFKAGWDDFSDGPEAYLYDYPLSSNFHYYSHERGLANDYYDVAAKAVMVIVTNHVLSMFDALWTASSYNKRLQMNVTLKPEQAGYRLEYSTVLNLRYNF